MTADGPFFQTSLVEKVFVVEICRPVGSLSDSVVLTQLDDVLDLLTTSKLTRVLIDFKQTPYFGSSLLEGLRLIWNKIHPLGGRMVLCNASPVGREILELAKFDQLWPLVDGRETGLKRLNSGK